MLRRQGYNTVIATSIAWAKEQLSRRERPLIIIDMPMQTLMDRQQVRQFCEQRGKRADVLLLAEEKFDRSLDGRDIIGEEIPRNPVRREPRRTGQAGQTQRAANSMIPQSSGSRRDIVKKFRRW